MYHSQNIVNQKSKPHISADLIEFAELLLYLFIAFILIYYTGARLSRLAFLIILPVVWFSKRDYFWLVFFFILMEMPGGLFSGGERDDPQRLPIYSLIPGISFSIQELYILTLLAKSLFVTKTQNSGTHLFFKNDLKTLAYYLVLLLFISPLMGMSFGSMSQAFKIVLPLTLLYSLFRILDTDEKIIRLLRLLFPFAFITLALQAFELVNGQQVISMVKPGVTVVQGVLSTTEPGGWIRPIEMGHAMFITFTGSLWLLMNKRHNFNRYYLISVNLVSFLAVFMSGTRSWIIAFAAGYIVFIYLTGIRSTTILMRSLIIIFILVLLINFVPIIHNQVLNAFSRVKTIEAVAQGDITGGGTISRYDVKAPGVMKAFWSSSIIFGAGFSNLFFDYSNGHIGYHNILLNAGIIGLFLFLSIIVKLLYYPFRISGKYPGPNKIAFKISIIPLLILLIINTGTQTIGYTPLGINRVILIFYALFMIELASRIYLERINIAHN